MTTLYERAQREWHEAVGTERTTVRSASDRTLSLRLRLIAEECAELAEAVEERDTVAVAHELADLLYVTFGMADVLSLPIAEVYEEVHRANMSKFPVTKREDGKILKGPNYVAPNVAHVLASR